MNFIRLAVAIGAAAFAANHYMKSRREAASSTGMDVPPGKAVSSSDDMELDGAANRAAVEDTTAGGGSSLNPAEHLQAQGLAGTAGSAQSGGDLLRSNGQDGPDDIQPGLPDLTRGA